MEQGDNHNFNLFYGLKDQDLLHISEVENGLKCNCICPACEKKLIARNGGVKRIHHFAHYKSAECRYGVQTSIHIAAKKAIENSKIFKVPKVSIFINTEIEVIDDWFSRTNFVSHGYFTELSEAKEITIDEVYLERWLHKYIPDVIIVTKGKKLVIEIAVTHFVGRSKLQKIRDSKISAIEIDLSDLKSDFNIDEIEEHIINGIYRKEWLFNVYQENETMKIQQSLNQKKQDDIQKEQKEKEKREKWYKQFYKPVTLYKTNDYSIQQVENCPLKKRKIEDKFIANVKSDCANCEHSRYLRENEKYLICLYDYNKLKNVKKSST